MPDTQNKTAAAWLVLLIVAVANYGNFYVYDSIGPVADLLQRQRGFSDTQIGLLNAIYSAPNVVLILIGGVLVDRFGAGLMMVATGAMMVLGALLTALGPDFAWMAAGRLLFGIGGETNNIATLAAVATYFAGSSVAFAMGLALAMGRAGSFSADMSPTWFAGAYARGWQPPLEIAALIMAISLGGAVVYLLLDRKLRGRSPATGATEERPRLVARDLLNFGTAYWYLLILCVLWYAVILAFRSTFSIKYFQHAHGLDLATAGAMNSYVFLAAIFATPAFGWICDRLGRYAPMLAFGALLLPIALLIMATTHLSLWIATVLIGISYSLVPAVMWPLLSKLVKPTQFGTALGLMWVVQNAGIGAGNVIAGHLNDAAGASSSNPGGYLPMMTFFGITSTLGFLFALMLWHRAGRREHEAVVHRA